MSILINMEMPTRCFSCQMCDVENEEVNCAVSHGSYIEYREVDQKVAIQERPSDCPLIEVPPHGDLIDRDALKNLITKDLTQEENLHLFTVLKFLLQYLDKAPTVIEASEVET